MEYVNYYFKFFLMGGDFFFEMRYCENGFVSVLVL